MTSCAKRITKMSQLNEVTQKQAVHIQSLIQENSKLNTKLLPKVIEKKTMVDVLVIKNLSVLIKKQLIVSIIDTIKYLFISSSV